ncbi:MAG TPA: transposase [Verrucomicrobiae bacterium]|nr:transposase [Verrucomicrobiae bacterium]
MQRYRCVRCAKTFSDSPLDGIRTEHDKVVQIIKLLVEGVGVRATARLTGCQHKTVLSVLETIGQKCETLHDKLVRHVTTGSLQIDELWARVGISQRRTTESDVERGDQYTFLAVTAREKFIVSHYTGKRNLENTDTFIGDVAKRIDGRIQITTDSFRPYPYIVRKHLLDRLDFATMQKIYGTGFNNPADPNRRYSPGVCKSVKIKVRAGAPRPDRINTSYVERTNLTVRHFNKRFARLGLGYSRKLENHRHAIALFVTAYNFCKVHTTLGCTPAVGLKLATETWTIEKLIEELTTN